MHKILMISNTSNYFNITIGNRLNEEYDIIETKAETNEMSKVPDNIGTWMLFLDKELLESPKDMIFIKDKALENEAMLFLIGEEDEITEAKENIEKIKDLNVNYISSGALTHSAPILDVSLKNLHPIQ